ncbi:MAG: murein hydrolase activator EnvC family protein [Parvibaculales bacterium]
MRAEPTKFLPLILALLVGHPAAPTLAQEAPQRMDALSDEIKDRRAKQKRLQSEAAQLKAQQVALRKRAIALARDLQNIDADRDRLEARLSELAVIENRLDEDMQRDRAALSQLLAGLQAMQTQPAPAFAVHADDALDAVQGALVMTAVVPTMQARAGDLRDRLTELAAIRRRMDKQSADLLAAEQDAATARADLHLALEEKAKAEKVARAAAAREARAIAKLVREARNLRDLASKLRARQKAAPPVPQSGPFGKARGFVPLPVAGTVVSRFGENNANGVNQRGLSIAARPGAQITAPFDAQVLYSGPFRQYGEIVILSLAGGYQMILAGLTGTQAYVGQDLLAGEPVGVLPSEREIGASSVGRSQLYMELRYKGEPIDPTPWLKRG